MNLSHLQYFRELAQVQHYTKAAHNLFISQPTLSHSIAALEDELGVKLFEKNGRTVKLTDDGALFAQYVERSLDALEDGIGELEKRKGRLSGTVRLGAIHSVRSAFLPEAVLAYRRTHGNLVELKIDQGSTKELLDYLHTGENDLAITSEVKGERASCSRRSSAKGWLSSSMKVTHLPPVAASALVSLPICRSTLIEKTSSSVPK